MDPGTRIVYVANIVDGTVSVIDGATRTVIATVPVGQTPYRVAVDPGTHTVYVTGSVPWRGVSSGGVSVIEFR